MSIKIFNSSRTVDSIAWDLALTLSAKDQEASTPDALLQKITSLLPSCHESANKLFNEESELHENIGLLVRERR